MPQLCLMSSEKQQPSSGLLNLFLKLILAKVSFILFVFISVSLTHTNTLNTSQYPYSLHAKISADKILAGRLAV